MHRSDVVIGAVVTAVGVAAFATALQMSFFSRGIPGPGFFPTLLSAALGVLGLVLVAQGLRGRQPAIRAIGTVDPVEGNKRRGSNDDPAADPPRVSRTAAVWIGFVVAIPVLTLLGFVPAMIVLMAYLVLGVERRRSPGAVVAVLVVPMAAYLLFVDLLGIALPAGALGIGGLGL